MRATVVSVAIFICSLTLTSSGLFADRVSDQNPIPENFTNLQVLPVGTDRGALVATMRNFAIGLGVRCEHCHVGEGNDLSQFDFASDNKATKGVARQMLRMAMAINGTHLEGIGDPSEAPKVTCFTCHRGELKPATAARASSASVP